MVTWSVELVEIQTEASVEFWSDRVVDGVYDTSVRDVYGYTDAHNSGYVYLRDADGSWFSTTLNADGLHTFTGVAAGPADASSAIRQRDVLLRDRYEREFRRFTADNPRVQTTFHGWVAPEEVPRRMNTAVIGLVAGMGGIRTLAAGALCIGVGARGSVGVQVGSNLRAGLWTNFGDHGTPQFTPTSITSDLERVLQPGAYEEAVGFARTAARRTRSGSVVRDALLTALQCG